MHPASPALTMSSRASGHTSDRHVSINLYAMVSWSLFLFLGIFVPTSPISSSITPPPIVPMTL
ncbi:hypothetical protein GW17_00036452 [Ensete ventricosum]|nr:hypothetical protein GW17_00036452 [Ensete ventricosum]